MDNMWICPECGRTFKRKNQSHYCGKAPDTIDEYISKQEENMQLKLVNLKNTISQAIPETVETIAWSMPTWKKNNNILHFALQKNHIGLHVGQDAIEFFKDKLINFETNKGVVRLKRDEDLPTELISEIAKWLYIKDQNS